MLRGFDPGLGSTRPLRRSPGFRGQLRLENSLESPEKLGDLVSRWIRERTPTVLDIDPHRPACVPQPFDDALVSPFGLLDLVIEILQALSETNRELGDGWRKLDQSPAPKSTGFRAM